MTRIAYFVHNLADSAVARRIVMLRAGGAEVVVAGFCREDRPPTEVAGARAIALGRTHDANLGQRARMVLRNLARPGLLAEVAEGADVVMARNLEMLVLAARAAKIGKVPRLVYESLDIHRSLLGSGPASKALRWTERWLMRQSSLLLYSSPAFLRNYFAPMQGLTIPALLVENKLLALDGAPPAPISPPAGPPYTIGWFGNLRCKRTLAILRQLADAGQGRIKVLICGKPSTAEFPDFASQSAHAHIRYLGPYTAADLPGLYAQCHFAWAIDFFEEGLNSTWLLPNRLYESAIFGTVPIALAAVETGHWLGSRGAGLLLAQVAGGPDVAGEVMARLGALDGDSYAALRAAVEAIPGYELICEVQECHDLVAQLAGRK